MGAEPGGAATGGVAPDRTVAGGFETDRAAPAGAPSSQQLRECRSPPPLSGCVSGMLGAAASGVELLVLRYRPLETLPLLEVLELLAVPLVLLEVLTVLLELVEVLEVLEVLLELLEVLLELLEAMEVLEVLLELLEVLLELLEALEVLEVLLELLEVLLELLEALVLVRHLSLAHTGCHCVPSTAPLRVPRRSPPPSSLPTLADPESDSVRAACPTVTRLLATVVSDPSFESTAASALVAELVNFSARCRLDYAASLVAESESVCPPSVGGECALGTDVLEDIQEDLECLAVTAPHLVSMLIAPEGDPDAPDIPTPRSYAEAIEGHYSSQWQSAMDAEMASWKSTSNYVDEVPPPGANIVSGMWIFRVKRPPGSPPFFKARYVARGFSHREGVDFFQTFSPTLKMTTLRVLLHAAAKRDYELHSLDFSTTFLQGSLHEEI
ncbi:unnamed protein product [Closterium sp. NIES-64]|nr:unnamed protein product [Closterium sp. NIES-64]